MINTKTKNTILAVLVLIVASSIPALIFNKWVEATIFIICHTLIREQFKKQYHHIIPAVCRTITACVMFFGVSFVLPLELSLISAIPINYFISWIGFTKKNSDDFEIKCIELEEEINKLISNVKETKDIDLSNMKESELRDFCNNKGICDRDIDFLVDFIINPKGLKKYQIATKYSYERSYIYTKAHGLIKILKEKS